MARPQKHTIDYFPHYVTHGKTLLILRNEHGNDGYAFWYQLLELLCNSDGQYYDTRKPASWRLLLAQTGVNDEIATNILNILAEVDAIDAELWNSDGVIWVQNLVNNLELVYRRRSTTMPTRPVSVNKNPISDDQNRQTKLNKTKLNKTKLNKTIDDGGTTETNDNTIQIMVYENHRLRVPVAWWATFKAEFSDLDIEAELKKFADHWYGGKRKLKNVRLALRNWFVKAREIKARSNGADGTPSARKIKEGWG